MPSGRTHDRITLWSLPWVAGLTFVLTRSGNLTLLVVGAYLFSGLMFGPDLDLNSRPYKRWGWLRWIWIPYQKTLRHRSFWSHGPIIGTTLRVIYLLVWVCILVMLGLAFVLLFWGIGWSWTLFSQFALGWLSRSFLQHQAEWLATFIGLEVGAMSHALSDWGGSTHKRVKTRGLSVLKPQLSKKKPQKRKPSQRKVQKRTTKPVVESRQGMQRRQR